MMPFYYSCPRRVLGGLSAQILLQERSGVQRAGICCASLRHSGVPLCLRISGNAPYVIPESRHPESVITKNPAQN